MQVRGCYTGSGVCKAISDKVMAIRDGRKGGVNHMPSRQRPLSVKVLYRDFSKAKRPVRLEYRRVSSER